MRSAHTITALNHLRKVREQGHIVAPIDNGSTDTRARDWAVHEFGGVPRITRASIAEAVNHVWYTYEKYLNAGEMIAIKHDADIITRGDWVNDILALFRMEPDVYLAGPMFARQKYEGDWVIEQHPTWFETKFVYGGVQARSPRCWRAIGYARQPYGFWGWSDHYDAWRVKHLGKKLAVVETCYFVELDKDHSAIPDQEKEEHKEKGRMAFKRLIRQIERGERDIREP